MTLTSRASVYARDRKCSQGPRETKNSTPHPWEEDERGVRARRTNAIFPDKAPKRDTEENRGLRQKKVAVPAHAPPVFCSNA